MPIYVQLVAVISGEGKFDEKKDTERLNDVLRKLQHNGAKIVGITSSIGTSGDSDGGIVTAVYVITYEAYEPVSI